MKRMKLVLPVLIALLLLSSCSRPSSKVKGEKSSKSRTVPVVVTTPRFETIEKPLFLTAIVHGKGEVGVYPDLPGKFKGFAVHQGERVGKDQTIMWLVRDIPGANYPPVPVKAPTSGIVNLLPLEEGQLVTPQIQVATIVKTDSLKVVFHIPEKYAFRVKTGQRVLIETQKGHWMESRIKWMSSLLDAVTHTREAYALLEGKGLGILPGSVVQVKLSVVKKENVMVIPYDAVLKDALSYVYIVKDGIAHKRVVDLGITDFVNVEIRMGLTAEDSVVIVGQQLLKEGQPVKVESEEGESKG